MKRISIAVAAIGAMATLSSPAHGQEAFLGEIKTFANTFCPDRYAEANGQTLPISQNAALFSLYGTRFGGNGVSTFNLPNLQGVATMGAGQGPGLSPRMLGTRYGSENITVAVGHTHELRAATTGPAVNAPAGAGIPSHDSGLTPFKSSPALNTTMAPSVIGETGLDSVENRQPYIVVRYCVSLDGLYPSRN
ncbi:MAG: tail fiber protein [Pseudomonadota bacterium]